MHTPPWLRLTVGVLLILVIREPRDTKAAVDASGDLLPARAKVRIGTTRFRHGDTVTAVTFSPDGRSVATASRDGTLSIWESEGGKELARFKGHTSSVLDVVFTPSGQRLVSGGVDGTVRVWQISHPPQSGLPADGEEVRRFGVKEEVQAVAIAAGGSTVAASTTNGVIHLWNLKDGKERRLPRREKGFGGIVGQLGVSHFGEDGTRLRYQDAVYCLALSADGKQLAANHAAWGVELWDVAKGEKPRLLDDDGAVASLSFAPDGRTLAVGFHDNRLVLWDTRAGKEMRRLAGHKQQPAGDRTSVLSVAFSADGRRLASGGTDNRVRVWDVATGRQLSAAKGHSDGVTAVAFAPDGKHLVSGSADNTVRLWASATGREVSPRRESASALSAVSLTPDGRTLALLSSSDQLTLWSVTDGREQRLPAVLALGRATAAAFAPDGKTLAVAASDGRLRFWDTATQAVRATEQESPRRLDRLLWSPDGKTLASYGPEHNIDLWNGVNGELLQHIGLQEDDYLGLAFDRQGRRLAAASLSSRSEVGIRLWDSRTGLESQPISGDFAGALALSFSADGRSLHAAGDDGRVRLCERAVKQPRRMFRTGARYISAAAFTPDGRFLATGSADGAVRLWNAASGKERHVFRGHRGPITMLAFAGHSPVLASTSRDTTALVWDVTDLLQTETPPRLDLSAREVASQWEKLAGDAPAAYDALLALHRAPGQAVVYLAGRMRPVRPDFARMLTDLDSDIYNVRVQAYRQLVSFGRVPEKILRQTLKNKPSLEVRRRIENLLEETRDGAEMAPASSREVRGVELLERIGSVEARRLLQVLAGGIEEAELTQQAKASLDRLAQRSR